jgi:hypothetical protein
MYLINSYIQEYMHMLPLTMLILWYIEIDVSEDAYFLYMIL